MLVYLFMTLNLFCKYTKKNAPRKTPGAFWVDDGARTHDTRNHNPMLYQLNYIHHVGSAKVGNFYGFASNAIIFLNNSEFVRNSPYICKNSAFPIEWMESATTLGT